MKTQELECLQEGRLGSGPSAAHLNRWNVDQKSECGIPAGLMNGNSKLRRRHV